MHISSNSLPKLAKAAVLASLVLTTPGCGIFRSTPSKWQQGLMATIVESGGRFNDDAAENPLRVTTVYLPKSALGEIRPTNLAVFPNLRALMIIDVIDGEEKALTGSNVDAADDLLALEYAYKDAKWIE